jgi:hypothetical protein
MEDKVEEGKKVITYSKNMPTDIRTSLDGLRGDNDASFRPFTIVLAPC